MQVAQVRRPGNQRQWAVRVGGAAQDGVERQLRQLDAGPEHGALNEVLRWVRFFWGRISLVLLLQERLQPRALALAPPPATAGRGWEGVPTVRGDAQRHPPPTPPCLRRGGSQSSRLPPLLQKQSAGRRTRARCQIGRAHVSNPVTNALLVCRPAREKK